MSPRAVILLVLAAALALPAATAAKADPCAADQRLVNAWHKVLADNGKITARQTAILQEIFRRLSTNQAVPPELFDELRTLVAKNRRQLAAGERRIVLIKPGTANGRELKRLVLRFIRVVARPLNNCIGKLLVADTPEKLDAVVQCVDSTSRARVALSRDVSRSLKRVQANRSRCARP
ncbi:MAG TPA: hypothetical protein VFP31_07655 [Gaiellaceae bacterium]|nr:hypothetical protein [Gaiellaceae bacterium]